MNESIELTCKRKRLTSLMKELRKSTKPPTIGERKVVNYHGPYINASGERFFLPKEWVVGGGKWKALDIEFLFDNEMNGTHLIRNLDWLGKTNKLLSMEVDNGEEGSDDDEMTYLSKKLSGRSLSKKTHQS